MNKNRALASLGLAERYIESLVQANPLNVLALNASNELFTVRQELEKLDDNSEE